MSIKWLTENSYKRKSYRSLLLLITCLALLLTSACGLLPEEEDEEILPTITPPKISQKPQYEVKTGEMKTSVRAFGKMMSKKEEQLFFIDEGKRVKGIYAEVGQKLNAGDLIAELDTTDLERDLRQKKLEMRSKELTMIETLRKADELTPEELEQAKITFELSRLDIVKLEENIERAKIKAPFTGTLVGLSIKKGDVVSAYKPVATISDLNLLTVAAEVNTNDLKKIAVGLETLVDINGVGAVKGKVKLLPSTTTNDNNNGGGMDPNNPNAPQDTIEKYVQIELDTKPEQALNRGTPLSVEIIVQRKADAVKIPLAALRTHNGRSYVQVIEKDGSKREVDVEVGQQTSTEAEILSGLTPGQKVVGR